MVGSLVLSPTDAASQEAVVGLAQRVVSLLYRSRGCCDVCVNLSLNKSQSRIVDVQKTSADARHIASCRIGLSQPHTRCGNSIPVLYLDLPCPALYVNHS